jgi:hypothetical protein
MLLPVIGNVGYVGSAGPQCHADLAPLLADVRQQTGMTLTDGASIDVKARPAS